MYQTVIRNSTDPTEQKKAIISNGFYNTFMWHIWAIISVSASIVLLLLNFMEYSIAGEIGGSAGTTANYLGALQFAVKAHEITIVASLYMIARQWILGSLINMDKGIPLGLLGAEKELGQPSFVISKGYLVTVSYVVSLWRSKQGQSDLFLLTIFLFAATVVSSLAGPASGVLMIPIKDWFLDPASPRPGPPMANYAYIMVRPTLEYSETPIADPFDPRMLDMPDSVFQYWSLFAHQSAVVESVPQAESTHDITFGLTTVRVNISTTPGRSLEGNTGLTYAKTVMATDILAHGYWIMQDNGTVKLSLENEMVPN